MCWYRELVNNALVDFNINSALYINVPIPKIKCILQFHQHFCCTNLSLFHSDLRTLTLSLLLNLNVMLNRIVPSFVARSLFICKYFFFFRYQSALFIFLDFTIPLASVPIILCWAWHYLFAEDLDVVAAYFDVYRGILVVSVLDT